MNTNRCLHRMSRSFPVLILATLMLLGGCAGDLRDRELEMVAKDWMKVMRASQVLPVYPVTEDLEPGDVFVVTTPIQAQADLYRKKGYFPLDLLAVRLDLPENAYQNFYGPRYWDGTFATVTHPRPGQPSTTRIMASRVYFPTYEITVDSRGGFTAALPIQGIPVAIDLASTSNATVDVTLTDAYTYALPGSMLLERLFEWATKPEVRDYLSELATESQEEVFLRVVNRVYLVKEVSVTATSDSDLGYGGAVRIPDLESVMTDPAKLQQYKDSMKALNEAMSAARQHTDQEANSNPSENEEDAGEAENAPPARSTPGGSVRVRQILSRSITLDEDFGQPLVIGYLGFDVPIRKNGDLGPAVATLARLEQRSVHRRLSVSERSTEELLYRLMKIDMSELDADERREAIDSIARGLKEKSFKRFIDSSTSDAELFRSFKSALDTWLAEGDAVRYRRVHRLWRSWYESTD